MAEGGTQEANCKRTLDECKYKGVTWDEEERKWEANVRLGSEETVKLGLCKSAEAAARVHDCSVILLFGYDSVTNFPVGSFGEEELERARQSLCFHANPVVRQQARRELKKQLEREEGVGKRPLVGEEQQPRVCVGGKGVPPGIDHGKENNSGRIFSASKFKPSGCNFQRWSQSHHRTRRKNERKLVDGPLRISAQLFPREGVQNCRDATRRAGLKGGKNVPVESGFNSWGVKKPSRKTRTRTCRKVPPPIPAAPLGSTKWQYRGISWNQALGLWTAYLYDPENKKTVYLGTRKSQQEAAALHDWGMQILQGQNAVTNFPKRSSHPSFHELKQVKDRLVAARSVTEDVALLRMSKLLPEGKDKRIKKSGGWYSSCLGQESLSINKQIGGTSTMNLSKTALTGLKDKIQPPRAAGFKSHDATKSAYCLSTANPDELNFTDIKIGNPAIQGFKNSAATNYNDFAMLQLMGPIVAIGVNLIEAGPLSGQYLITIGTDRKDTVVPVGYASTAMQAAQVYDMVILAIYGHHAILNFPASSYQLRTLGSIIASLPHLFTPHMFWKGMATAEAAGVKNDLSFNGMHSVFPYSAYEADLETSEFRDPYNQPQRYNPLTSGIVQSENQNPLWISQAVDFHSRDPTKTENCKKTFVGGSDSRVAEDLRNTVNVPQIRRSCADLSQIKSNRLTSLGRKHSQGHDKCSFAASTMFREVVLRKDDHTCPLRTTAELNEEDIHAARTLTLLGCARNSMILEGDSDASDARNLLGIGRTCFQGVCKLQKDIFMANIKYNDHLLEIGRFEDLVHAAQAHDMVALGLLGTRAWTNFPPSTFTCKDIHEALERMQDRYPQMNKSLLLRNSIFSPDQSKVNSANYCAFYSKDKVSSEVTRTGRVVRKPKRFQQGFPKLPVWDGPTCEWISSLGYLNNEQKDERHTAFYLQS